MAIERRDPVPKGRYWLFLLEGEEERWQAWVTEHRDSVRVIASETKQKLAPYRPAIFATRPDLSIIMEEGGAWVLFDVLAPTPWVGLGYPTIVTDPAVHSSTDIEQAPAPLPDDALAQQLWSQVKGLLFWGGLIYLGGQVIASRGKR
ncbi:MAG TPA: hypothetical protein VGQ57_15350 [Polyangiaceae bacterium]|jgi:hypothetical protein|nr:hypothetical protein [Polyangiaceae bacterium]